MSGILKLKALQSARFEGFEEDAVDDKTAIAHVSYALSDISFVHPITLSNYLGEAAVFLSNNGVENVNGKPGQVYSHVYRESLAGKTLESLQQGQLATVYTASQNLPQMIPNMYQIAQSSLPCVFHVAAQTLTRQNTIEEDHSDIMSVRHTGFAILSAHSPQECHDLAVIAHIASLKSRVPFLHFYDGLRSDEPTQLVQLQRLISYDRLAEAYKGATNLNEEGEREEQSPLFVRQSKKASARFLALPAVVEAAMTDLATLLGREYQPFEYVGSSSAELLLVVMGTAASVAEKTIKSLVNGSSKRVGLIKVRLYRPWSTAHFLRAVPLTTKKVAVLDRCVDPATMGEPLFQDVLASFQRKESWQGPTPVVVNARYGLEGESFTTSSVYKVLDKLVDAVSSSGFTVANGYNSYKPKVVTPAQNGASEVNASGDNAPEAPYLKMLTKLFNERLVVANLIADETVWGSNSALAQVSNRSFKDLLTDNYELDENAERGFGLHLALQQKRKRLQSLVSDILTGAAGQLASEELRTALAGWKKEASPSASADYAAQISFMLEAERSKHPRLEELYSQRHLLPKPSQWILGSDQWASDIGNSGLHHVIASGENIKVLVLDTLPYSEVKKGNTKNGKKDLGLYAMNYGGCYVASVALYDSYSHVLRAFSEADAFDGPAIVLAYAPQLALDVDAPDRILHYLDETQAAVSSGYWPLYRWNPAKEENGEKSFSLDSHTLKQEMQQFLERGNHLTLLAAPTPSFPPSLSGSLDAELEKRHAKMRADALAASFAKLQSALGDTTPLLILFASDSGKAEGYARRLEEEARVRGCQTRILEMNAFSPDELVGEKNVLFVCSTAGQGEFPANGKEFWHALAGSSVSLEGTRFAIFGLGDRHYWPRPDEKHYFCKAAKDIDVKLEELGGERMVRCGLGDDQDADGPETEFEAWRPEFWEALGVGGAAGVELAPKKTNEDIKVKSNFLRGTIAEGLQDASTGSLSADDQQLTKFHGIYQQDNRDIRQERKAAGMEPAYSFMIRVRVPGGVTTPEQWLAMDELADVYANGTLKLTTRQAYQLHGVIKKHLKKTIQGINRSLMDTLAACGDVNRNVMCNVTPEVSSVHAEVVEISKQLSAHLSPQTSAYHEIWLDKKLVAGTQDVEPIYGATYLPRKFKIAIAVPPSNDVDVFAHCLGFIAVIAYGKLIGFNVSVGGGMGMTHGNRATFPRLADVMAFCTLDQVCDVAEKIVTIQRDYGDRKNRKHARFKYTVEDLGVPFIRAELEKRLGYKLQEPKPFKFTTTGDRFGWTKGANDTWNYTMFVEGGRVIDHEEYPLKTALREIAKIHDGDFRLTANQNLVIGNVKSAKKALIDSTLKSFGVGNNAHTGLRLNSIACAALPLCALAFAEAERYLPSLIDRLDEVIEAAGLREQDIIIRMTGCPNGCGRPYLGEIGFVGKAPGIYNLYLGAGHGGERLNKLYRDGVNEDQIIEELTPIIQRYAREREENENFGDFVIRAGYVKPCLAAPLVPVRAPGETFHDVDF